MGAQCCSNEAGNPVEKINPIQAQEGSPGGNGFPPDSAVQITIVGAHGLTRADWKDGDGPHDLCELKGPKEPYCICEIPGKAASKVRTTMSHDTRDPTWNFQAIMSAYKTPDTLLFTVFDRDFSNYEDHLGKAQLSAARLEAGSGVYEGSLPLAGIEGVNTVPLLSVKVEAVPRPQKEKSVNTAGKKPQMRGSEVIAGRIIRMAISKEKGQPLGLLLYKTGNKGVLVTEVDEEGAVAEYNKDAKLSEQLLVGDIIQEANGMTTEEEIVMELCKSDDLELVVESRCKIFPVVLKKKSTAQSLGIQLKFKDRRDPLIVGDIIGGAVEDHNSEHEQEESKIFSGDHIIAVNGIRQHMLRVEELKGSKESLEFLLRRVVGPLHPEQKAALAGEDIVQGNGDENEAGC